MKWLSTNRWMIRKFASALVVCLLPTAAVLGQIKSISLDLRNNFSSYHTRQAQDGLDLQTYGQFYVLGVNGFALDPQLLNFSIQTSLTDFSSKNKWLGSTQSLRNRNLGYYNVSLSLLEKTGYPVQFYAVRSLSENMSSGDMSNLSAPMIQTSNEVETMGLRWSLQKNAYIPQVDLSIERSGNRAISDIFPTSDRSDVLSLRLSNSNRKGTAQYSFQYSGTRFQSDLKIPTGYPSSANPLGGSFEFAQIRRTNNEFQFYGNSKVSNQTEVYSNVIYSSRDYGTIMTAEVGTTYKESDKVQHELKLKNAQGIYQGFLTNRSNANSIVEQTHVSFSNNVQGLFGASYLVQENELGDVGTTVDRGEGNAQVYFNKPTSIAEITGSASTSFGFERYSLSPRRFVQQSQLSIGGTSPAIKGLEIILRNDASFATTYSLGNIVQNNIMLRTTTSIIPRFIIGAEASRSDSKYLTYTTISPLSVTRVGGNIITRLTPTTAVEIRHYQSWISSWYLEKVTQTSVNISESGLIRNLTFQLRGERSFNNVTKLLILGIDGIANYQFYAFTFTARYTLRTIAGFQTQGVILEVHRLFSFSFQ
ncbi:MAG: hypothetical protein M1470_05505 [Bacteroidetes bacterium]|nr:hypothetical protein [Bacteroidota bacterium]MCL5737272.1 hypothetical protein [Bacteroidota bacterium]